MVRVCHSASDRKHLVAAIAVVTGKDGRNPRGIFLRFGRGRENPKPNWQHLLPVHADLPRAALVREKVAGLKKDDKDTILGDPIGREALLSELRAEFVPYSPEELVDIANKEFAWCEKEMLRAAADLGRRRVRLLRPAARRLLAARLADGLRAADVAALARAGR